MQDLLKKSAIASELVFIKSEGDIDTITPLYALGVQGVFTRTLDAALLNNRIDMAVHSMKDVPVQLAKGIRQAAVLKRGSHKDILVPHPGLADPQAIFGRGVLKVSRVTLAQVGSKSTERVETRDEDTGNKVDAVVATSSIRRIAQWSRRYPHHRIENLRGNVNTRLRKLKESSWHGAIFAAAGLERINLRPENSIDLDWMLPAPAQGAIMLVCRENDDYAFESCRSLNDEETALCTRIERDFLSGLLGGCSTPISALAQVKDGEVHFTGNIVSPTSYHIAECSYQLPIAEAYDLGSVAAKKLLSDGAQTIIEKLKHAEK